VDPSRPSVRRERWRRTARQVTALFRAHPDVFDAQVAGRGGEDGPLDGQQRGHRARHRAVLYGVHLQAVARAVDGQLLENGRDFYAPAEKDLPSADALSAAARDVVAELEALRVAPAIDPYSGPAILEPEAAGVLFHEAVGHRLEGERIEDDDEGQTFKGQVGRPSSPRSSPSWTTRPSGGRGASP